MLMNRERASRLLGELGVEAFVACTGPNFNYVSGFGTDSSHWGGGPFAILPTDGSKIPTLIVGSDEMPYVGMDPEFKPDVRIVGRSIEPKVPSPDYVPNEAEARLLDAWEQGKEHVYTDRIDALADTLKDLGLDKADVGFDNVQLARRLQDQGGFQGRIIDAESTLKLIRSVKTPQEVAILRKANEINLRGLEDVLIALKEGAPFNEALIQHDIRAAKEGAMRSVGKRVSGIGRYASHIFPIPYLETYQPQKGDLIRFDFEITYERYWSDLGRTACIGEPSAKAVQYYQAMVAGREAAMEKMRPGNTAHDVQKAAVKAIQENGNPNFVVGNGLPMFHNIGLELYEVWSWYPKGHFVIEEDMAINFEAPYFEMGFGGMQLEDTYLIKQDGVVDLSPTLSRDILIV